MDPEATYRELLDAIAENDREVAMEHASNLLRWLAAGGFAPVVEPRVVGVPYLQTVLAESLCRAVLEPSSISFLPGVNHDDDQE